MDGHRPYAISHKPSAMTGVPSTRREFVSNAILLPTLFTQVAGARLVGTVPLGAVGGAASPPFGRLLGDGLDARLFTDLSQLGGSSQSEIRNPQSALVTSTERFFVRTAAPPSLP